MLNIRLIFSPVFLQDTQSAVGIPRASVILGVCSRLCGRSSSSIGVVSSKLFFQFPEQRITESDLNCARRIERLKVGLGVLV